MPAVWLCLASAALVAIVACSPAATPEIRRVAIATEDAPSEICLMAIVRGRLVPHSAWGIALEIEPGRFAQPIFPFGYTAATDGTRIALLDRHGRIVAFTGDVIQSGGGYLPGDRSVVFCNDSIKVIPG